MTMQHPLRRMWHLIHPVKNNISARRRPLGWLVLCVLSVYGIWLLSTAVKACPAPSLRSGPWRPPPASSGNSVASIRTDELAYAGSEGDSVCEKGSAQGMQLTLSEDLIAPLVVVAHNRVSYLVRAMMHLLNYWSQDGTNQQKFPLFISVDGGDPRTLLFAAALKDAAAVQVLTRIRDRQKCDFYDCHISLHFKMLLQLFFQCLRAPRLLFLEEDLQVAPDFFSYFKATSKLLDQDESLWCISAWNDHGQKGRAANNTALYRTDIIPGLGWMTNARHGKQLAAIWPDTGWDHWMRNAENRQGRQCVFPEIPRTQTFGKEGSHSGENYDNNTFFNAYLAPMQLNQQLVDWNRQDLRYLLKENYAKLMQHWLAGAAEYDRAKYGSLASYCDANKPPDEGNVGDLYVTYEGTVGSRSSYMNITKTLVPMLGDLASGFPRGSYNGVVVVRCRGRRLFLRPVESLLGRQGLWRHG